MGKFISSIALFLEREAGYHVVSLALIVAGIVIVDAAQRGPLGHDLVVFGLGVLSRSMAGAKADAPGTTKTVDTHQRSSIPPLPPESKESA